MKSTQHLSRSRWIWPLVAMAVLIFYFIFDPLETNFMPKCFFHEITGFQCVGCGSQRVIHALLHGQIADAFKANSFLVCMFPVLVFYIWLEIRRKHFATLYAKAHSKVIMAIFAVILLAWMLIRNILEI